jgi:hypothetical protein
MLDHHAARQIDPASVKQWHIQKDDLRAYFYLLGMT